MADYRSLWSLLPEEVSLTNQHHLQKPLSECLRAGTSSDGLGTTFLLTQKPHASKVANHDAAVVYNLPDLEPALRDYMTERSYADWSGCQDHTSPPLTFT